MNEITTESRPFVAPLVDKAAQFIESQGWVTVSELAEFLDAAGVNVHGDVELTGRDLACTSRRDRFLPLDVIASGSLQFVRIVAALLINRAVDLDAANTALVKLTSAGCDAARTKVKSPTGGHYHVLTVRDPGGSQQVAECWEGHDSLSTIEQYLDEIVLRDAVDEGWDAFYIVGCGLDRRRCDEISALSVEEWGAPYWQAPIPREIGHSMRVSSM
ncbi:Mycobacterium numidiamassiliense ORFan [Mycobacterium numidiamassiliense]|uniref:Mycobacterium numidiamassiliense ORFan n=1 Tax=Mycobacterium numidiamassiliense TaxID=1841861 RepID=A0A2U3P9T7_9MYCO|nr:hypothetical protein [Mycobacterium numidiamassiliense]SPM40518.1 Mycobacterium numidiamassiliense ORFan [Mycobacterium numidiamassiliense]